MVPAAQGEVLTQLPAAAEPGGLVCICGRESKLSRADREERARCVAAGGALCDSELLLRGLLQGRLSVEEHRVG